MEKKARVVHHAAPKPAPAPVAESAPPPVTATVGQDALSGLWTVDVSIAHGDHTVLRVNGRAVWQGTP
jgi:hypothetical protein